MATIKSFTNLEQSKVLAKILPLESADMFYNEEPDETYRKDIVDTKYPMVIREGQKHRLEEYGIPCWSLAALLDVLPKGTRLLKSATDDTYHCDCPKGNIDKWFDNPVDACVAMIEKLHELKML